jgi:hypothetical protein
MALTAEQQELLDAQTAASTAIQNAQIAATAANEMMRCKADCLRMAQSIIFENRRLADANSPDITAADVTTLAATLNTWINS